VDAITDPEPTADEYAEEKLVRIPECLWCFRPTEDAPPVAPSPAEKTGRVTIGCFNSLSKITPRVVETWAEVLRRAPAAALLLKNKRLYDPPTLAALRSRFESLGVDAARVDVMPYAPNRLDHLRTYDRIDFQLDTFPYNGTTTTCESFWQGVPVVAVEGKVHAARVSQSLLHAVGLDELVAKDLEGYIQTAAALAQDIPRLSKLRSSMRGRMESSALRDEKGYCERFGRILLDAWNARGDATTH
jgi:predicted O-linked N-acetylglucosamine transferase (SPINDLY family)